jgi:flagellar basal-body rod protein FlgB
MLANGATTLSLKPQVVEMSNLTLRNDGNSVDIEREMATLATTTLEFNSLAEVMSRRFSMHRMIATDGR